MEYRARNQTTKAVRYTGEIQDIWDVFGKSGIRHIMDFDHEFVVKHSDGRKFIFLTGADGYSKPCRDGDWVLPDFKPGTYIAISDEDFRNVFVAADSSKTQELVIEPLMQMLPAVELLPVTHMLTLNVMVGNADDYIVVHESFCETAQEMGKVFPSAQVSVHQVTRDGDTVTEFDNPPSVYSVTDALLDHGLDSREVSDIIAHMKRRGVVTDNVFAQETHTEQTLVKVREILSEAGMFSADITDAISNMQNRGILFRERAQ